MDKNKKIVNVELFLAKRIHFSQHKSDKKISRPAVRIATIGIAIGLAVMLVAVAIVIGFKKEIRNKVVGFGSHIQITNLDSNATYETAPIVVDSSLLESLAALPEVRHVQRFATKPGIVKTETEFEGIILKGVDTDFDWDFFSPKHGRRRCVDFFRFGNRQWHYYFNRSFTTAPVKAGRQFCYLFYTRPGSGA
jgi:ABC-type lipoprotein release transport system permease subunit